jgi:hypothetical protein
MPQLDTFTFLSQFFWFGITFWTMYVLVFSFFIIPASFIVKAQSVMRVTSVTEAPSLDVFSTTRFSNSKTLDTFVLNERSSLDLAYSSSLKNLLSSKNQINAHIFKSTSFQAPLTSLYTNVFQDSLNTDKK